MIRDRQEHPPTSVEYAVFLKALFTSHGIQGQGMKYPDHVSARRKCSVQCSILVLTHDLKDAFPKFPKADFQVDKKFLHFCIILKTHPRFNLSLAARTYLPTSLVKMT